MSTLAAELVAELGLEPGQSYTETIGDCEVLVRNGAKPVEPSVEEPEDEPSQFAYMVMLEPWFETPPAVVGTMTARFSDAPPAIDPVHIEEWDRSPE